MTKKKSVVAARRIIGSGTIDPSITVVTDDTAIALRSDLEATKEELRRLFSKRRTLGFTGARRHMAPEQLQLEITRLSSKLRSLKHSDDIARFGRFSKHAQKRRRKQPAS